MLGGSGGGGGHPASFIQYLESSGTQYIDTGLIADSDTDISITFWNFLLADTFVFGARGDNGVGDKMYDLMFQGYAVQIDFGETRKSLEPNPFALGMHTFEFKNKIAYVDGVSQETFTDTFTGSYSQLLFGFHRGSTISISAKERIYRVTYSKDGVLLRDFLPALDNNGVAGMWDNVSKTMYYNAGTGTFVVPT